MKVPCYICDVSTEIDDILSHLRRHSDAESARAYKKGRTGKTKATGPLDTGVGTVVKKKVSPEFVQLDTNNESVVISGNGDNEPV